MASGDLYTRSRTHHNFSELSDRKQIQSPNVKTVSIFLNNLDIHIAESYQKLRRKNREKPSSDKQWINRNESVRFDEISIRDHSTALDSISKLALTVRKGQESDSLFHPEREDDMVLIENEEVMEYINIVNQLYSLPDPMGVSRAKKKIKIRSSSKKTFSGTSSIKKKSSVSSFKDKIVLHRDIDLNPFTTAGEGSRKEEFDFSLLSELPQEKVKEYRGTDVKRNADGIGERRKINDNSNAKTPPPSASYTPQLYRYCFACEQIVLQANLRHHQQSCVLLQQTFYKGFSEVIDLLDKKIERLTKEIQRDIVQATNDRLLEEFRLLKRSVGQWIQDVKMISISGRQHRFPNHFRKNFNAVQKSSQAIMSNRLEAVLKLHWFARLRQNIAKACG